VLSYSASVCFFSRAETCASVSTSPSHTELYSRQRFLNDSDRSIHKMTTNTSYSPDIIHKSTTYT
ncbi:MAG TPA: hypothetical protein VIU43_07240, partial [Nitrosospira sp.]